MLALSTADVGSTPSPAVNATAPAGVGIVLKASPKTPGLKRGFAYNAKLS